MVGRLPLEPLVATAGEELGPAPDWAPAGPPAPPVGWDTVPVGRPQNLTTELLQRIGAAAMAGLGRDDIAAAAGVGRSTLMGYLAAARAVSELLVEGWEDWTVARLRRLAARLGIEASDVVGSGKRGGKLRADWVRAIPGQGVYPPRAGDGRYPVGLLLDLLDVLERAAPRGEAVTVQQLARSGKGGQEVKRSWTKKRYRVEGETRTLIEVEEREELRELPPHPMSLRFMLERHPKWRARWGSGAQITPQAFEDYLGRLAAVVAAEITDPQALLRIEEAWSRIPLGAAPGLE